MQVGVPALAQDVGGRQLALNSLEPEPFTSQVGQTRPWRQGGVTCPRTLTAKFVHGHLESYRN